MPKPYRIQTATSKPHCRFRTSEAQAVSARIGPKTDPYRIVSIELTDLCIVFPHSAFKKTTSDTASTSLIINVLMTSLLLMT